MKFLDIGNERDIFADGVHDDAPAIQACLDRMKNGGTVYFPDGIYLISSCLIFYSHQRLVFSDNAVLLRSAESGNITRYMLASYSESDVGGYDGTHDVVICGGIFDGNARLKEKLTIMNTVHCSDIVIKNCRFTNGAMWHYIELSATKNALISGCVFDGTAYTDMRENLTSELVQIDAPDTNTYGPVYNCRSELIDFSMDKTPCSNIEIDSCIFKCSGFTAIGHHGNYAHSDIKIHDNIFTGVSGIGDKSRGCITFQEKVFNAEIFNNAFISHADKSTKSLGITAMNPDKSACLVHGNSFIGYFSEHLFGGITAENNDFGESIK